MKKTILVFAAALATIAFCVFAKVNRDRKGEMRTERARSSDVAELTVTDPPIAGEKAETVGEVSKSTGEGPLDRLLRAIVDGKIAGRVDDIGNDHFRVALFAMPFHPGDQPAAIFRGRAVWEGSGGNHTYLDDEGLWALEVNVIGALDTPDFHLLERDSWADAFDLGAARPARKSLWPEIVAKGAL